MKRAICVAILVALGCRGNGDGTPANQVRVEACFVPTGRHAAKDCMKALAASHASLEDGLLFFERDSRLRVTPPRGHHAEPYHVHLEHRVAGQTLDHAAGQNEKGVIEIDLSKFDEPERVIVASSAHKATGTRESAVTPPYVLSLRLLPADQKFVMDLQDWRYEVKTEVGTLSVFVQPHGRGDMLLTWVDGERSLDSVIQETPYVYAKGEDAYLPPRLVVDVTTARGTVWGRAATYPRPAGSSPLVLRTPRRELIGFAPPARVEVALPEKPAGTSALIGAKYSELRATDSLRFVLGAAYPVAARGGDFAARVTTHEVAHETGEASYVADLGHLDASAFPVTSALVFRLVAPWRLRAGMYRPVPPRGTATVSLKAGGDLPKLHGKVLIPRHASHYDWLVFYGAGKSGDGVPGLLSEYWGGGGPAGGPSPNVVPPGVPVLPTAGPAPTPDARRLGGTDDTRTREERNNDNGTIVVNLFCPPKPHGCGQDAASCQCIPHVWNMSDVMGLIQQAFPRACDFAWSGLHGDLADCHKVTEIGQARISWWGDSFQLNHKWFDVKVRFGPCKGKQKDPPFPPPPPPPPPPPKPPKDHEPPKQPPNAPNGLPPLGPDTPSIDRFKVSITDTPVGEPLVDWADGNISSTGFPLPYNDPSIIVRGCELAEALGPGQGRTPLAILPISLFSLAGLQDDVKAIQQLDTEFADAYYARSNADMPPRTLSDPETGPGSFFPFFVPGIEIVTGGTGCGALGIETLGILAIFGLVRRRRKSS